jgi:hypothetical protein
LFFEDFEAGQDVVSMCSDIIHVFVTVRQREVLKGKPTMNLVVIAQRSNGIAFGILHIDIEITVSEMVVSETFDIQRNYGDVLMPSIG